MIRVRSKEQGVGVVGLPREDVADPEEAISSLRKALHLAFWTKEWLLVGGVSDE